MSPHPIGDECKTITADDDIFVVLTPPPDISAACSAQSRHESLLGTCVDDSKRRVLVGREKLAGHDEGLLAVVRIGLELSRPGAELFLGWLTQEGPDIGERHARVTERINHQGLRQLTRRVIAIP
jgi:hypothetical protein